eukprot:scaffold129715_cov34-Prasinocladus_malaysianus.AAC.1
MARQPARRCIQPGVSRRHFAIVRNFNCNVAIRWAVLGLLLWMIDAAKGGACPSDCPGYEECPDITALPGPIRGVRDTA